MTKIEQELIKYIDQLNVVANEDWGERFKIELLSFNGYYTGLLARFKMTDTKRNIVEEDVQKFYKIGKKYFGYQIWDSFNKFVNKRLESEKGEEENGKTNINNG